MGALFLTIAVTTFLIANVAAYRVLVRVHPRRRAIVIALIIVGNAMWIFFPTLNARTDFSRFVRATLGPPWFAWSCFAILYSAFALLLAVAWLPVMRRMTFARFARWPSRLFLWTTLFALVVGVWNALVPLRIERVPVALDNLPKEMNGFRVALISDLHTGLYSRQSRLETIFATAAAQKPDVILLAGDNIDDDPVFTTKLLAATRVLDARMPLIAVLGNHEMYGDPFEVIRRLRGSRIHLLVNEGVSVRSIWIAGISDFASRTPRLAPDVDAALRGGQGSFPILLAHQPKAFAEAMRRGLPLTLCRHSHGGQCAIRPLHWSLSGMFLPYHMGLYQHGTSQLYVNTGTGYWLLPWRFGIGISPEISVIELHGLIRR
ncbi:MAG TPA: metallophosphoesterase [Thermoanaerobaculia bacterium]|nr:metallophosphoesterase [Thermoanaerobaculia bacterium]